MTTRLLVGDVFARMAELDDHSFDLIVTSPPFLALRSYLPDDHPDKAKEIGSEATPAEYLDVLLALTAEWRRLLAPHGSIAIELGDTYAGSGGAGGDYGDQGWRTGQLTYKQQQQVAPSEGRGPRIRDRRHNAVTGNKNRDKRPGWPLDKSLTGIPTLYTWSLAYGRNLLTGEPSPAGKWRIRNLKPWIRSNPPVGALGDKERPATSYITVACVGASRWFDLDAVRTPSPAPPRTATPGTKGPNLDRGDLGAGNFGVSPGGAPPLDWWHPVDALIDAVINQRARQGPTRRTVSHGGIKGDMNGKRDSLGPYDAPAPGVTGKHIRRALTDAGILPPHPDAIDISPKGYAGAHYAVWPPELVRLLVDEMCPRRVCRECGVPSRRLVTPTEYIETPARPLRDDEARRYGSIDGKRHNDHRVTSHSTAGWSECDCPEFVAPGSSRPQAVCSSGSEGSTPGATSKWRPGRILDPFSGSGTTLAVASGMGRDSVGIDLDPRNADLTAERVGMFLEVDYGTREVTA